MLTLPCCQWRKTMTLARIQAFPIALHPFCVIYPSPLPPIADALLLDEVFFSGARAPSTHLTPLPPFLDSTMQLHSVALAFTDPPPVADALVDEGYLTCMQLHSVALAFTDPSPRTDAVVKVSPPQMAGETISDAGNVHMLLLD